MCVAMFNAKKAHDTLLRAFAGVPAPMRLILVGDGPLRPNIVRLIADLGLADRVVLTGQQPPTVVAPLLAGSICSVLPSRNEPFGIAAVESMFLGTPVVSSDAQGLAEVVEHERTGLTFPIDDVPALTAALNRLLGDPQLRARLAAAALTHAEANFDWRRAASRYVATAYASTTPRAPAATRA